MAKLNLGINAIVENNVRGVTRTGHTHEAYAATAWGSSIPDGRFIVASPVYAAILATGSEVYGERTASLPDATGDYVSNPILGVLLKDDPDTLANFKAHNGDYVVLGVAHRGQSCHMKPCEKPSNFPVGNKEVHLRSQEARDGESLSVGVHGYYGVEVAEDVTMGMTNADLSITDVPTLDGETEIAGLGALAAGAGAIAIPDWMSVRVTRGAKAGGTAEIYIGG